MPVAPSIAELARGEKSPYSLNHSVTHSLSIFDSPGTEAFAAEQTTLTTVFDDTVDLDCFSLEHDDLLTD